MAKASINFQLALRSALRHNDRTEDREPEYLLPTQYRGKNEVDRSAAEAEQMIADLYRQAKDNYRDKFGQKIQSKSYVWEAVVNLNKEHTLEDVQRLAQAIEKETGFTYVQVAIHRDEGRVERAENGEEFAIHNLHAHLTFFTLDRQTGEQLYRRQVTEKQKERGIQPMNRERLSRLQDLTARVLRMERGERGSKRKRMGHKEYKQAKRDEEERARQERAKIKDLQEVNRQLRAKLREMGAKRAQYAELEASIRELRGRIKGGDGMTQAELIDKASEIIDQLSDRLSTASTAAEQQQKDDQIRNLTVDNEKLREELAETRYREEKLHNELSGYKEKWNKLIGAIRNELGSFGQSLIDKITGTGGERPKETENEILAKLKEQNARKREENAARKRIQRKGM